jgi:pimeloyl-ACP methyl ester carboxylesterase
MRTVELAHEWSGPVDGPVTVVLHGGGPGCHATSDFAAIKDRLPRRRLLWVDLPGYGGSPPPDAPMPAPLTAAAHTLARLLGQLGLARVDVLAQSLGGSVAFALAAHRPDTIGRIVAIGCQPTAKPGGRTDLTRDPDLGARVRAEYYGGDGPTLTGMRTLMTELEWYDAELVPDHMVQDRHHAATAARAPVADRAPVEDLGELLGSVTAPSLVVWGRHDPFAGPDYAAALADALPRGDLAVIGRTAHHPQSERPDTIAALTAAFLTDRS